MPRGLCFSHSGTMPWDYFYVARHRQGKEKDSRGDGEGGIAGGETRPWLILTTQGWCFSELSNTELLWFSPCLCFPPGKMVSERPELIVQEEHPGHQPSPWRRTVNKGSLPTRENVIVGDLLAPEMPGEVKDVANGPGTFCLRLPAKRIQVKENPLTGERRREGLVCKHPQTWPSDWLEIPSCMIQAQQNQG